MADETHAALDSIPVAEQNDGFEGRYTEFGEYTVAVERFPAGTDFSPLLVGLPDDLCQCPHWGYCFEGEFVVRYADKHEETISAGEAYYMPPGHSPRFVEDSRTLEFSPTKELETTVAVVERNMAST